MERTKATLSARWGISAAVCIAAMTLAACGGGGDSNSSGTVAPSIDSAVVTLNPPTTTQTPKQISLGWVAGGPGAVAITEFRVQMRASDTSAYAQLGSSVPAASTSTVADLLDLTALDWKQASVRVQACNAGGACVASNDQPLIGVLASAVGYFKASNTGASDVFGSSVALSADGNTMAVAATGEDSGADGVNAAQNDEAAVDSGAVYIFTRSASGWSQQAYLKASNSASTGFFGDSLALSSDGSTLAVGAPGESSGGLNSGAVYVFVRSGTLWSQQAYLKSVNGGAGDLFGQSIALSGSGNTLAVGARGEASAATGSEGDENDNTKPLSGAAYVFARAANGVWSKEEYLKASNSGINDLFGTRVVLSADGATLAVSAEREGSAATGVDGNQADNTATDAGAVYVFTRLSGLGGIHWGQQAYLKASNTTSFSRFGSDLAISSDGNTLAVGTPLEDSSATGVNPGGIVIQAADSGAAYVFVRSAAGVWTQDAYIKASNTDSGDRFASALALSADGNKLAIGASQEGSAATTVNGPQGNRAEGVASGAVYTFVRIRGIWVQQSYVKAPNNDADDRFGYAVALSGDGASLAVGSPQEGSASTGLAGDRTSNGALSSGAVYLY